MAVQKNFVVKNGIEVNTNLIYADLNQNAVGVGTTVAPEKLQVNGGIGATSIILTGVGTFPTADIETALVDTGRITVGFVTSLSGSISTYTTSEVTNLSATNGYVVTGVVTTVSGTDLTYTNINGTVVDAGTVIVDNLYATTGVVTTLSGTDLTYTNVNVSTIDTDTIIVDNLYATTGVVTTLSGSISTYTTSEVTNLSATNGYIVSGIVTSLSSENLQVTGVSTLGTVQVSSGIITASSGIVTYYGDGSNLDLANNPSTGIGIGTTGGVIGYGVTFVNFYGAGVSTSFYNSSVGIATIFFEGGGGGGGAIGIGSTFPGTPLSPLEAPANGDLFFHIDYGRTFIYYDEVVLGVGSSAFWVDSSPFNVGIITTLTNVSFNPGSATSPSMYFVGDPQTGFFSPTPGEFTVVSTGSSVLNINSSGINVTGVITGTTARIGAATTFTEDLVVQGDARVTGILTVGTTSIILNGSDNSINVGSGVTIDGNSGIVYANTFYGDGSGLTGNINTAGIITASAVIVGSAVTINSTGLYTISGIVTAFDFDSLSDINYKENVETVDNALDIVSDLRGVKFDWKETKQPSYGVIAQELEEVLPELVHGDNPKVVNYNGIIGVLIEAIKELKKEIEDLK